MYFLKKMTPVRLFKNFSDLYTYSFWKVLSPCTAIKDCTFIRDIRVNHQTLEKA